MQPASKKHGHSSHSCMQVLCVGRKKNILFKKIPLILHMFLKIFKVVNLLLFWKHQINIKICLIYICVRVCVRARVRVEQPQLEICGEECGQVFCFLFTEECGGWLPVGFENIWSTTEGYTDKIQLWWNGYNFTSIPSFVLARKLKALMEGMRKWNKRKFGDVGSTKEELLIELQLLDG